MPDLVGPDGADGSGAVHPGLPWAGCSILAAGPRALRELRAKAAGKDSLFMVDMPAQAQTSRVYDEYLARLAGTTSEDLDYLAVSLVGARNKVGRLIGRLPLLG